MNILFSHARVLRKAGDAFTLLQDCAVGVQDDRILFVGQPPARFVADRIIDCRGGLLLPGFVNAHTHSPLCLLRGAGEDRRLQPWLEQSVWPFEAKHTHDSCYWGALLNMAESIRCGATCLNDMYIHSDAVAEAAEQSGMRALITPTITDQLLSESPGLFTQVQALAQKYQSNPLIQIGIAPHSIYTCSAQTLRQIAKLCEQSPMPVHVHVSETRQELLNSLARYGGNTPLQVLDKLGLVHNNTLLAHCTHFTEEDSLLAAARDACVVHCPRSNLKLGSGIAPVADMLAHGVRIAIGTDSSASNNNQDILEELRFAALLQKGTQGDPSVLPLSKCFEMVFHAPLPAMGFSDCGMIAAGSQADLIVIDTSEVCWLPDIDPLSNLLYAAHSTHVSLTMVAGKILYENGTYLTIDVDQLRFEVQKIITRFLKE